MAEQLSDVTDSSGAIVPMEAMTLSDKILDPKTVKTNIQLSTPEGKVMLVRATLGDAVKIETLNKQDFLLTAYLQHPASKVAPNGEVQEFTRTVLFDENGLAYDCGSMGVEKSIAVIRMVRGEGPWARPVKVRVNSRRTSGNKMWMTLDPDTDDLLLACGGKPATTTQPADAKKGK